MINYEDLLCIFRQPVYKGHHTLKVPMAIIVEALLDKTISELEDIATLHIAALHVFPGLISLNINKKERKIEREIEREGERERERERERDR